MIGSSSQLPPSIHDSRTFNNFRVTMDPDEQPKTLKDVNSHDDKPGDAGVSHEADAAVAEPGDAEATAEKEDSLIAAAPDATNTVVDVAAYAAAQATDGELNEPAPPEPSSDTGIQVTGDEATTAASSEGPAGGRQQKAPAEATEQQEQEPPAVATEQQEQAAPAETTEQQGQGQEQEQEAPAETTGQEQQEQQQLPESQLEQLPDQQEQEQTGPDARPAQAASDEPAPAGEGAQQVPQAEQAQTEVQTEEQAQPEVLTDTHAQSEQQGQQGQQEQQEHQADGSGMGEDAAAMGEAQEAAQYFEPGLRVSQGISAWRSAAALQPMSTAAALLARPERARATGPILHHPRCSCCLPVHRCTMQPCAPRVLIISCDTAPAAMPPHPPLHRPSLPR